MTRERTCVVTFLEEEWIAHYDYSPGRPAVMYLRNGDPGYPEDPAELCVNRLTRGRGAERIDGADLSEADLESVEAQCWDAVQADEDAYWAQAEYQMEFDR